jgi:hypothetical protein
MSKPSPRLDQLRALREAKYARNMQSQRAEEKPAAPAKRAPAKAQEAFLTAPVLAEVAPAASEPAPVKKTVAKAAAKPEAKVKAEKPAKKAAKKTAKKKAG